MDKQQIIQALKVSRFSAGLSEEDVGQLAGISRMTEFAAGATIFSEGTETTELYVLQQGRVELCMNVPARGCLPILTLEGGDLLGWSAVVGQTEMTATAVAVTDTQAIGIASDKLRLLCDQDHDIGYEIMRRVAIALSRRLVAARLQVLDMFSGSPPNTPGTVMETPQ